MRLAVVAAVCLSMVGLVVAADAHASIKMQTDIPAQGLGPALKTLAKDRGFQVVFRTEVVGDARTHGATGDLTTPEALTKLLEGTSLTYTFLDENTVTILPRAELESGSASDRKSGPTSGGAAQGGDNKEGQKSSSFRLAQVDQGSPQGAASVRATESSATAESPRLEEIIVTAQKREERLQDVPVPVTVLNADTLAENGKVLLTDYFSSVPGLNLQPSILGSTFLAIRGITTSGFTNPTVGVVVDDVPFTSSTSSFDSQEVPDIDPGDLSRVEVLRGPQGTLYGSNSMGGLIKFVTRDPSTDAFTGRVEAGTNDVYNGASPGFSFRGSGNVPLSDTTAIRVSAYTRQDPGYIDDPPTHSRGVNEAESYGGRAAFLWRPSEDFSLKVSALFQNTKALGSAMVVSAPGLGDLQQNFAPDSGGYDRTVQAYSALATYNAGPFRLTSVTGYSVNHTINTIDTASELGDLTQYGVPGVFDGFGVRGTVYVNNFNTEKLSQELRASASLGPWEFLVGGFYTRETDPGEETTVQAEDEITGRVVGVALNTRLVADASKFQEYAAFADVTYHVTDRFDVQVGGRESWDSESDAPQVSTGPFVPVLDGAASPFVSFAQSAKASTFTYLATPRFKITPDLMAYARFASGFRPGLPNSPSLIAEGAPASVAPDKTQDYELGLKGDFFEHTLSVDASAYYIDWKNIQIQLINQFGFAYGANGSAAKSEGFELSVTARPATGLTLSAWGAFDNAVLTKDFVNSPSYGRAGDRLPVSSRLSANMSVTQEFPLGTLATGFAGGELSYVGNRLGQFNGFEDAAMTIPLPREVFPGYAKLDLQAGVKKDLWKTLVYVNNVVDRRGVLNGGPTDLYLPNVTVYIQPRTVGLTVTRAF